MTESQQVAQRRRDKILSRSTEQTALGEENNPSEVQAAPTVFDRYKSLKLKEENERNIINLSRYGGLVILPLSFILPPWLAFTSLVIIFVVKVLAIMKSPKVEEKGNSASLLNKIPFLGKLKYLSLIINLIKVTANLLLSYAMATVLLNAVYLLARKHVLQQQAVEQTPLTQPTEL